MSKKLKISLNVGVSIALMSIYVLTFIVDRFTGPKILLLPFIMCVGTLTLLFILFSKLDPLYYLSAVGFAFFALYLGTMLHFYAIIPIYDLLLHFASGILLVFAGNLAFGWLVKNDAEKLRRIPHQINIVFCTLFSISAAAIWEIWEFSGDVLFGLTSQGSQISDTMTDIIAGTVAAIIGSIILHFILKKTTR